MYLVAVRNDDDRQQFYTVSDRKSGCLIQKFISGRIVNRKAVTDGSSVLSTMTCGREREALSNVVLL